MGFDIGPGSQCPHCGYPTLTNEHAADCPTRKDAAPAVPEAKDESEQRLAQARLRLKEFAEDAKREVEDAVKEGRLRKPEDHKANSQEIGEAKDIIEELLLAKDMPKVTVSREHLAAILKDGLRERPTAYQKEVAAIVGTLGREPLLPEDEDRVILELDLKPGEVVPRFTGPARVFEGVVAVRGTRVPPERIRVIDPKKEPPGEEAPKAA